MHLVALCLSRILDITTAMDMKRMAMKWWAIVHLRRDSHSGLIWDTIIGSSMIKNVDMLGYDVNVKD
jgi:hypothetical protein